MSSMQPNRTVLAAQRQDQINRAKIARQRAGVLCELADCIRSVSDAELFRNRILRQLCKETQAGNPSRRLSK